MPNIKTAEFINLYNHLEALLREQYPNMPRDKGAIAWVLSNDSRRFRSVKDELDYCREIRNFIQHGQQISGSYAVIPSDAMIASLSRAIDEIENPPRAWDVCTKAQDVFSATIEDRVRPAMRVMVEEGYTHIPILDCVLQPR